jgi:hypothetical protein
MPTLQTQIAALASTFASSVLAAIRSSSLQEILSEGGHGAPAKRGPGRPKTVQNGTAKSAPVAAPKAAPKGKGGRLARRSAEEIEKVVGLVVGTLGKHKEGLRSEQLQKALGLSKQEIVGPLTQALAAKKITKKGQRRSTTYFLSK